MDLENFDYDYLGACINDGRTLRDQFAMAALTGLLSDGQSSRVRALQSGLTLTGGAAEFSYSYADAMMKAREKTDD